MFQAKEGTVVLEHLHRVRTGAPTHEGQGCAVYEKAAVSAWSSENCLGLIEGGQFIQDTVIEANGPTHFFLPKGLGPSPTPSPTPTATE